MALFSPATTNSSCKTGPQLSGPPKVTIFGGGGVGALANAIVSPTSSSIIAFDIVDSGSGYTDNTFISIEDLSGKGKGASAKAKKLKDKTRTIKDKIVKVQGESNRISDGGTTTITGGTATIVDTSDVIVDSNIITSGSKIDINENITTITGGITTFIGGNVGEFGIENIAVLSSGDGYLTGPDGSLCGNGFVWKEPDEGYIITADGNYLVVQINRPVNVSPGDVYYPPNGSSREIAAPETITLNLEPVTPPIADVLGNPYQVLLSIEEVVVLDSGFGYRPEDKIIITPDNGAVLEPVINSIGQIESVKVISGGIGFSDIPEIKTNSLSGFNAQMNPIFKVTRLNENIALDIPKNATIIDVIDCVGNF